MPPGRRTVLVLVAAVGCAFHPPHVPVDPDVTFAAHEEHGRVVVDRLPGDGAAVATPPGWLRRPGGATFVLRRDGETISALWLGAPGEVEVRASPSRSAPLLGTVDASRDDGAIRLSLRPAGGAALRTDVLERTSPGGGPAVLTRTAQTDLDVRGTYRAEVRDAAGKPAGWLRVRIGPYQPAPRIYDGVLPSGFPPGLAVAAAIAVGSEVDWIEAHAIDVYRGVGGGPLEQSIPMGGQR